MKQEQILQTYHFLNPEPGDEDKARRLQGDGFQRSSAGMSGGSGRRRKIIKETVHKETA